MIDAAKTHTVTPFEARLLTILRAIVRLGPLEPAIPYLKEKLDAPIGLSAGCVELICDHFSEGCIQFLLRQGGWRRERFLREGKPVVGRLWERTPVAELKLTFSEHSINFLLWLTAQQPGKSKTWTPPLDELTIADQLVLFLAYDCFHEADVVTAWRGYSLFANNALCRLSYATDFRGQSDQLPDYSRSVSGLGGAILESLQSPLTQAWLAMEHAKRDVNDWTIMGELGAAQDAVVDRFMDTAEKAGRMDLARFLLRAAVQYCSPGRAPEDVIGGLLTNAPHRLAERYAIQRQAGVLPRILSRLRNWERRARSVGYFDEGYAAAQMFLTDWDQAGADAALVVADRLVRELEPMSLTGVGEPA